MFEYFEKMGVESIKDPTGQDMFSQFQGISITELVVTIAVSLAIITFSTAVFGTLMYGFIKHNSKNVEKVREDQVRVSAKEFLPLIPGLLIVAFVCVNK
jgi:hypothetical protein